MVHFMVIPEEEISGKRKFYTIAPRSNDPFHPVCIEDVSINELANIKPGDETILSNMGDVTKNFIEICNPVSTSDIAAMFENLGGDSKIILQDEYVTFITYHPESLILLWYLRTWDGVFLFESETDISVGVFGKPETTKKFKIWDSNVMNREKLIQVATELNSYLIKTILAQ